MKKTCWGTWSKNLPGKWRTRLLDISILEANWSSIGRGTEGVRSRSTAYCPATGWWVARRSVVVQAVVRAARRARRLALVQVRRRRPALALTRCEPHVPPAGAAHLEQLSVLAVAQGHLAGPHGRVVRQRHQRAPHRTIVNVQRIQPKYPRSLW